jgi:hypothetical protein
MHRYGGVPCDAMYDEQVCDSPNCNVNACVLSEWSSWSTCGNKTGSCDAGIRTRTRQQVRLSSTLSSFIPAPPPRYVAAPSPLYPFVVLVACPSRPHSPPPTLPIFTHCPVLGAQIQPADQSAPPCETLVEYDRTGCPSSSLPASCSPACAFTEWVNQGSCSASCGSHGVQLQTRTRIAAGSQDCSSYPLQQYVPCNRIACPVNCAVGDWAEWSPCTAACGSGTRVRSRPVITSPSNGGTACPPLTEVVPCNTDTCSYNSTCILSAWSPWQACNMACGGGEQLRQRTVVVAPTQPGVDCQALVDRQPCNTDPCQDDNNSTCPVSEWGPWSTCSVTCVHDTQTRSRSLLSSDNCRPPVLTDVTNCTTAWCPSPVDCKLSDWSAWSVCSVGCGDGIQSRYRQVQVTPAYSGVPCGITYDTRNCVGAASGSACSPDAPSSEYVDKDFSRSRCAMLLFLFLGHAPFLISDPCPPCVSTNRLLSCSCAISPWSTWDACSAQCGGGMSHQYATVITPPTGPGAECPALVRSQACNTDTCSQVSRPAHGSWSLSLLLTARPSRKSYPPPPPPLVLTPRHLTPS